MHFTGHCITQVSVVFEEWEGTGRKDSKERVELRVLYMSG
jgi:hypothetical protein